MTMQYSVGSIDAVDGVNISIFPLKESTEKETTVTFGHFIYTCEKNSTTTTTKRNHCCERLRSFDSNNTESAFEKNMLKTMLTICIE